MSNAVAYLELGAVFQYIAPPAVQGLADAHVIGHDVEDEAHAREPAPS